MLADGVVIASRLSTTETTAIVHPHMFTTAMMQAAQGHGAGLRRGRVTGLVRNTHDATVRGVEVDGDVIEADAIVVAMGPWSLLAAEWMSLPVVFGQRSPSLVYDTGTDVPAHALFLDYHDENGETVGVEVFPRADGSTHITALSDIAPLPVDPTTVKPQVSRNRAPANDRGTVVTGFPRREDRRAASMLPSRHTGRPAPDW